MSTNTTDDRLGRELQRQAAADRPEPDPALRAKIMRAVQAAEPREAEPVVLATISPAGRWAAAAAIALMVGLAGWMLLGGPAGSDVATTDPPPLPTPAPDVAHTPAPAPTPKKPVVALADASILAAPLDYLAQDPIAIGEQMIGRGPSQLFKGIDAIVSSAPNP